jgi:hypothetical protein
MRKFSACHAGLLIATIAGGDPPKAPSWRYVDSPPADSPIRPVFRFVALSQDRPEEVTEEAAYRGKVRRYAQVRYGSDDSRRVVVVVDEVSRDDFDLYVDADRNRVIQAKDKVAGMGKERAGRLDVESTRGLQIEHEPRTVQWRLGIMRKTIGLATLGYIEGAVEMAGAKRQVRRVDGNANGFFADAADRLWIDLDGDKTLDPLAEQFPCAPVLTLNNQRYGIRGDAAGTRLTIEPLTAEGRIRLRLGGLGKDVSLLRLDVMLSGEDGSALAISALEAPTVVPAGRYALGSVALSVQLPGDPFPTHYVFSRVGVDARTRWHDLAKDQELVLDPVGKLRFNLDIEKSQRVCKPGDSIRVQPQLFTADGLLINSCALGESAEGSRYNNHKNCTVKLVDAARQPLDVQSSGFA